MLLYPKIGCQFIKFRFIKQLSCRASVQLQLLFSSCHAESAEVRKLRELNEPNNNSA